MSENSFNLVGAGRPDLEDFFIQRGEKKFRAQQLMQWVYQRGITDFNLMTDLSNSLRTLLLDDVKISKI